MCIFRVYMLSYTAVGLELYSVDSRYTPLHSGLQPNDILRVIFRSEEVVKFVGAGEYHTLS